MSVTGTKWAELVTFWHLGSMLESPALLKVSPCRL